MAQSGIPVNDECKKTFFEELKDKPKGKPRLKYIIFKLNKTQTEIVIDKVSTEANYESFLNDLPENEYRWAVYDFEYDLGDEGKRNKIIFISWAPDKAGLKIREKMTYSSSKAALSQALEGNGFPQVHATDFDELTEEELFRKAEPNRRR
ncbi:probable COF1-cofilin, actin binding and severing protein [Serendipita indica DSM 11827]|uniref:Cofilin n=1 Tax=Serendipita indica (strain DSM 11827) TaxID=1109443 RepID=G4TW03_SERID|nr:probable COF1-cofilin, actin binding and severing protein [Serendipita indica DSM 11827]